MRRTIFMVAALICFAACAVAQAPANNAAVDAAQKLVDQSPSAEHLEMLARAQIDSGAKATSLATFNRAVEALEKEKPAEGAPDADWKALAAKIYSGKASALVQLKRQGEAAAAWWSAAQVDAHPAGAWFNACALMYNIGAADGATEACRNAVTADPSRADAWFVLGSLLYANSTTDDAGNIVIPDDARQALTKYLQLAPTGPHAADVKAMLAMGKKP